MNFTVQIVLMSCINGYINTIEEIDFSDSSDSTDSYDVIDLPRIRINIIYIGMMIYYKYVYEHL